MEASARDMRHCTGMHSFSSCETEVDSLAKVMRTEACVLCKFAILACVLDGTGRYYCALA